MTRWHYLQAFVDRQEIEAACKEFSRALAPDVVGVRSHLGRQADGEPAIFFHVVLSRQACLPGSLTATMQAVERAILDRLSPHTRWGHYAYFRFVSKPGTGLGAEPVWRRANVTEVDFPKILGSRLVDFG